MTTLPMVSTNDHCESCVFCSSRYNRDRPSFCQCKHCSIPLCLDCIREHHDDILQSTAQLSHQYNELKELIQTKQNMIVDETTKTVDQVNQYFDTCINELRETQRKTIEDLQTTKQDAQNYVGRVNLDLDSLAIEIQALAKEGIVQTTKMNHLSTEIKRIEEQLNTYQVMRSDNAVKTKPPFIIKFACPSVRTEASHSDDVEASEDGAKDAKEATSTVPKPDTSHRPVTAKEQSIDQLKADDHPVDKNENYLTSDDDDIDNGDYDLPTSYDVDRMASDGKNILYAYYHPEEPDVIAYCLVDDEDGAADVSREWKQPRIEDMIWWNSINKFVCATDDAIYTVEYIWGRLKILCVLRDDYSHVRIAANTTNLFVHYTKDSEDTNEIEVYNTDFELVKTTDVYNEKYLSTSVSFCVTDHLLASICTRMQNSRPVFQVNFFNLDMQELRWLRLGECDDWIEIRCDGNDHFFITTGQQNMHIISFKGQKKTIELEKDGGCIAVLDNRRIAISKSRQDIELIEY